ncbi:Alcohol-forming fatty acyl-CoA reductase [Linum perenne]
MCVVFVEEILRIQPNVKKVTEKEVFRVVKEKWGTNFHQFITEKVVTIVGDISREDLGIENVHLKQQILTETEFFLHSAATTAFDERYDVALGTNTLGVGNVLSFSKKSYVNPDKEGILLEKPYLGKLDQIEQLINHECNLVKQRLHALQSKKLPENDIASAMKDLGLERARHYGWPNTYTFTKAMGEMIVLNSKGDIPLVIMRPTIITSTLKHPFPGWIEGARTIDAFIVNYAKGRVKILVYGPQVILDLIPADMVVNAIIVAMGMAVAVVANKNLDLIYHLGSSRNNPIKVSDVHRIGVTFFKNNPWTDRRNGKVVRPKKITTFSSISSFRIYTAIHFQLPLKVLGMWNAMLCNKYQVRYMDSRRKFKLGMRLIEYYAHYLLCKAVFDDTNLKKLVKWTSENGDDEREQLNLDTGSIDWEDYLMNAHIPGLLKFVMK